MKVGDLVIMKDDDVLGIILSRSKDAEVSWGTCWFVFWMDYGKIFSCWETEMEIVSECG